MAAPYWGCQSHQVVSGVKGSASDHATKATMAEPCSNHGTAGTDVVGRPASDGIERLQRQGRKQEEASQGDPPRGELAAAHRGAARQWKHADHRRVRRHELGREIAHQLPDDVAGRRGPFATGVRCLTQRRQGLHSGVTV